ncbi:hypothetical protein J3F84DRAFT_368948 [Trichoderma pleuroticola]
MPRCSGPALFKLGGCYMFGFAYICHRAADPVHTLASMLFLATSSCFMNILAMKRSYMPLKRRNDNPKRVHTRIHDGQATLHSETETSQHDVLLVVTLYS